MRKPRCPLWAIAATLFIVFSGGVFAETKASVKGLLSRNIQASGGREKLQGIRTIAFRIGGTKVFASASGELKMTTGKDPVITEAILVKHGRVRRNSFNGVKDIEGHQKTIYQTLAELYAGFFTLTKFAGRLETEGLKSYGPESLHALKMKSRPGGLEVHFFLRTDDFTLKRLLFRGKTPEGDTLEINYDFAPFEDQGGLKIPLAWFSSQVGARGTLTELVDVSWNPPLDKDVFSSLDVNVGTAAASPGSLEGNVLDFTASPYGLTIVTNWTKKEVNLAGLRSGDRLTISVDGVEAELTFYMAADEMPPQGELSKGARMLAPAPRGGETFAVQLIAVETKDFTARLKVLAPISAKKKTG